MAASQPRMTSEYLTITDQNLVFVFESSMYEMRWSKADNEKRTYVKEAQHL